MTSRDSYAPRLTGDQREAARQEMATQYAAGLSIRAIAEQAGRSYGAVRQCLIEAGVEMRPRGASGRPQ
jgi:transposase